MSWYWTALITLLIIVASAFFVIIEFALLAARRHRLEETAETSRASRAALRSMNHLTLMLAGAQLGITAATFALGAITKPAVHDAIMPLLEMTGIPAVAADGASFLLSLLIVTFLHLVIGEMMPKSWAIAHPEAAAKAIGIPADGYVRVLRPLLEWINSVANWLVRKAGEEPVDRAAARGYDSNTLRALIEHSSLTGTLDQDAATQISSIMMLETTTVGELVSKRNKPATAVDHDALVSEVQRKARESGHFRILLRPAPGESRRLRAVHVRDTLLVDPSTPAAELSREALEVSESLTLQEALDAMRAEHQQLAVVVPADGSRVIAGVITSSDLLEQIWPSIEGELSRPQA